MIRRHYFLTLIVLFAASAAWAVAEPTPEEREQQRHRVAELRKRPEQIARLREYLKRFQDLPEKRREAVARLDQELHALPAKKQDRYRNALERYVDWLEQLRKDDPRAYQAIQEAPDASSRLALIKERRDREWMATQPRSIKDEWQKLPGAARAEFVGKLRLDDRKKHEQWVIAKRFWIDLEKKKQMPCRLSDFSDKVKKYVEEYLVPTLNAEEKKQLVDAEGRWPDYPQALVAVAHKHPSALPPDPPRKFGQLPLPVQHRLVETKKGVAVKKAEKQIVSFEGPSFASNIVKHFPNKLPFENEYLAPNYNSLLKPMKEFVDKKLMPALDQTEKRKLADAEKQWPEYPLAIQELSQAHQLTPPWHILPEPARWNWELYRNTRSQSWGSEVAKQKDKKTP